MAVDQCIAELELHGFHFGEVGIILFSADSTRQKPKSLGGWLMAGGIFGDTIDQADGFSVMDGMTVTASIGALWGLVLGSRWAWGPVTWGLLGLLGGGLVGLLIDWLVPERRRARFKTKSVKGLIQVEVTVAHQDRFDLAVQTVKGCKAVQVAVIPKG